MVSHSYCDLVPTRGSTTHNIISQRCQSSQFDDKLLIQVKQIASNLGLGDSTKAQVCLNCHTTNVSEERQSSRFRASEGVSCEGCHGPGSLWLSNHSNPNTARSELMSQGKELFKIVKETFQSQTITNEDAIAILEQIVTIGRKGTLRELSSAEQSVMAIALITKDLPSNSNYFHASGDISNVVEGLYKVLSDENAFSPQRLKNNLKKLKVLEN